MRSTASGHSSGSTTGFSVWHCFKSFNFARIQFCSRTIRRLPARFVSPYSLNRATFYDHYSDKFALFEAMVAGDFHELLKERNICFDGTCPTAIEAIVLAVCDYLKEIHRNKKQCASKAFFGPLLVSAVTRTIRIVVLDGLAKRTTRNGVPNDVVASTISSAIYGATREWFYSKRRHRNDELVSFIAGVVGLMLKAGVRAHTISLGS
jgi:AcrR family transcriptional regulator